MVALIRPGIVGASGGRGGNRRVVFTWLGGLALTASLSLFHVGGAFAGLASRRSGESSPLLRPAWQTVINDDLIRQADGMLVVGDAVVLYSREFGTMWALSAESHRLLWQKRDIGYHGASAVGDRGLLVHERDALLLLDVRTGKPRWTRRLDGLFSDDGYLTIAGSLGCAVYHSPDQTISLSSLNRRTVADLRTGAQTQVRLAHNPLKVALELPPRFLYEEPDLTEWSAVVRELNSAVVEGKTAAEYPYSVGCLDAATGGGLWLADLGRISNRRRPEVIVLHPHLGVCKFVRATADARSTELWWLDLKSGKVLRKDRLSLDPSRVWPVLQTHGKAETARSLLASTYLLAVDDLVLSASRAEAPGKPLWTRSLKAVLPDPLKGREGVSWFVEGAWPFAVVRLERADSGRSLVLLIDVQHGVVWRVAEGVVACAGLSRRHNAVYVLSGNALAGYELPPVSAE